MKGYWCSFHDGSWSDGPGSESGIRRKSSGLLSILVRAQAGSPCARRVFIAFATPPTEPILGQICKAIDKWLLVKTGKRSELVRWDRTHHS
jgi:hypothetical protein